MGFLINFAYTYLHEMSKKDNRMMRRRLINAYASSIVSISMVLLLVGAAALLMVNARTVSDYVRESMQVSVILRPDAGQEDAALYQRSVETLPYVKSTRLVSREEGAEDLRRMLGEDFLSVFESSPVPISLEVSLNAAYVCPDSLAMVTAVLSRSDLVEEVNCQQSLVEALNSNLARISMVLGAFILIMLFISFVLIGNTVRLNVFARRFTVHTMKLVGATRSFIRRPFVLSSIWQGLLAALLALVILTGGVLYLRSTFVQLADMIGPMSLALVAAVVVASGVLICVVSTYFVVGRLISMGKDDLYY